MSETYPNGIDINTMILKTVSEVKEKEYSAIRKKLEDKKHSLQFLPAQMEAFSKSIQ